jgi:hypothetical protein
MGVNIPAGLYSADKQLALYGVANKGNVVCNLPGGLTMKAEISSGEGSEVKSDSILFANKLVLPIGLMSDVAGKYIDVAIPLEHAELLFGTYTVEIFVTTYDNKSLGSVDYLVASSDSINVNEGDKAIFNGNNSSVFSLNENNQADINIAFSNRSASANLEPTYVIIVYKFVVGASSGGQWTEISGLNYTVDTEANSKVIHFLLSEKGSYKVEIFADYPSNEPVADRREIGTFNFAVR